MIFEASFKHSKPPRSEAWRRAIYADRRADAGDIATVRETSMSLTDEQLTQYFEDGFLIVEDVSTRVLGGGGLGRAGSCG